jgi:hypothetical protein
MRTRWQSQEIDILGSISPPSLPSLPTSLYSSRRCRRRRRRCRCLVVVFPTRFFPYSLAFVLNNTKRTVYRRNPNQPRLYINCF